MNNFPLIGRQDVLKKIDSLIKESNSQHVICIEADGGVGKTRLLQEIFNIYQEQTDLRTVNIFDFDDEDFLSPKHTGETIANYLGRENFFPYFKAQDEYHQMVIAGVNFDVLSKSILDIRKKFEDCFNKVSETNRIILSFDTTDKLKKAKGMWQEFRSIANLRNVCVLLAGRNAHQIGDWLKQKNILTVENITLLPLSEVESELYLKEKQKKISIAILKKELLKRIVRLCKGKPILLDISIEWICQDINLDWIEKISFDKIDNDNIVEQFKSRLVERAKDIHPPADHLIHLMAYIYPLSKEMIAHFMSTDAHSLFSQVKEYVFIKQFSNGCCISLHDEFRSMIKKYVYPLDDEIRGYSREAALYFKEKSIEFKNKSKESVDINNKITFEKERYKCMERQVDYAFLYSIEEGMSYYKDVIWKLHHDSRTSIALRIQDKRKNDIVKFDKKQMIAYETLRARLLNDSGKPEEAESVLEYLLKKNGTFDKEEEADICNALAPVKFRLGKLEKALHYQLKAFRISEKINKDYLPDIANYTGYLYEKKGNLNKALEYYQKALAYSVGTSKKRELTAKILNNISHAYCQQGLSTEAQNRLDDAKKILSVVKKESLIARTEITQAIIYRDQDRYEESLECLNEAINRLQKRDDHQKLIKAFFHRGWTCWFQAAIELNKNSEAYEKKLKESKQYFEHSLELAEHYHLKSEQPGILHQMSHVYFLLGEKERAVAVNNKSYDLSCEVHDIRYAIDSLVGKAEFDYENGQHDNIAEYAQVLHNEYEEKGYDFPRFYGRMKRILADVAFYWKYYDTALKHYIEGLAQICLHRGYGIYTIDKELDRLKKQMQSLPDDETFNAWCVKMAVEWSARQPHEKYISLLNWCNSQQLARLQ